MSFLTGTCSAWSHGVVERSSRIPASMGMVVGFFLALAAMTVSYALGQGGPVAALVFLVVLLVSALVRIAQPSS